MPLAEGKEIEIRSDEVQEILTSVPSWMIRWGITLIFGIIMMCILLSYFIKYPDVISGSVSLTTTTPPVKLVPKASGEIERLLLPDNALVEKGDVIAQMRNPLSKEAVNFLQGFVLEVQRGLDAEFEKPITSSQTDAVFGTVQNDYNELVKSIADYRFTVNDGQFLTRKRILEKQITNYRKLNEINAKQIEYSNQNYAMATDKYQSNKSLYEKNVISKIEFYEQEVAYTQVKNEVENLKKNQVQNAITLTDYERQLNELEIEFLTKKMNLTQTITTGLNNIRNEINNWEETFLIVAPVSGRLNYLSQLSENQFVAQGVELFAIVPEQADAFIGYIQVDKTGYGKVEVGQDVKIRFDNFPAAEYGQVIAVVTHIAAIANEEKYLIQVSLPNGLLSTYKKQLEYTPEMSGQADIITEDLRILDRIFNQFRKLFDK